MIGAALAFALHALGPGNSPSWHEGHRIGPGRKTVFSRSRQDRSVHRPHTGKKQLAKAARRARGSM